LVAAAGDFEGAGGVGFGVVAGLGFGLFFAALAQTGDGSGFWPLVAARFSQVAILTVLVGRQTFLVGRQAFLVRRQGMGGSKRFGLPPAGNRLALVGLGVADMLANVFVLLAFRSGLLTLVGVLTSLYPAVTVLLAVWVLSEPIGPRQKVGLLLALLAAGLIAF
jgi:drug/metabolite transporter (DMT)-like permease